MTTIPLGQTAYKRQYSGAPEVVLQNRFLEKSPSNLREHATLLARPGNDALVTLSGGYSRGKFTKLGFFNGDLFVVVGPNLFRVNAVTGIATQITGTIGGLTGFVYMTWEKGIGYEYLFIADGTLLQVFSEHAYGVLTTTANPTEGDTIKINATYYMWSANVDSGSPDGSSSHPYRALLASGGATTDANMTQSLANMAALLNYSGTPGIDFSTAVPGPSPDVTAVSDTATLTVQAIVNTSAGDYATTVPVGSVESWANTTLIGGGGTTLRTISMPNAGEVAKAVANSSSYVLVSVGNSQKFYWLNPGELVIDPLNFAEKESNPDNILDMNSIGDQTLISGTESTENWYATGNFSAPFAPMEGRVYQRGIIEGTAAVVGDEIIFVGNDGIVYSVGYTYGSGGQYGVKPISDNAIAERVRETLRLEQGLRP